MLENLRSQESEFAEWKTHPVTKEFFLWVHQQREELKEAWANGSFAASFETEMLVKNAGATGACSAYEKILELSHEDFNTGE